MMLGLVFAASGLVMPGAGDVSTMDPTMAYGAAPNMLLFAPVTVTSSASALVTYFTSINCDFKQHFRTASCYSQSMKAGIGTLHGLSGKRIAVPRLYREYAPRGVNQRKVAPN